MPDSTKAGLRVLVCGGRDYEDDDLDYDEHDDTEDHEYDPGEDCGRWDQNAPGGMLRLSECRLGGTEFCDFECPHSRARAAGTTMGGERE